MIWEKQTTLNCAMQQLLIEGETSKLTENSANEIREYVHDFMSDVSMIGDCIVNRAAYTAHGSVLLENVKAEFVDATGVECAFNELCISTYDERYTAAIVDVVLQEIGVALMKNYQGIPFNIFVSVDCCASVINCWFHVLRKGEEYFDTDLENYSQPVMSQVLTT